MKKSKYILCVIFFLLNWIISFGQSTSTRSGAWTDPTVWSTNPILPGANQTEVINTGTTINGTPGGTTYQLDVKGKLIFEGNYTNGAGGLTIEDGGVMIIRGDLSTHSAIVINGSGKLYILGSLNESGGSITINNTGILVVGQIFSEVWQTTTVNNSATILVVGNYIVNGDLYKSGTSEIAVLGTVNGAGCPTCVSTIAPTDPASIFYYTGNPNLWSGTSNTTLTTITNWTSHIVPPTKTNIEFASASNNGIGATNDLILDADRTVDNLKNLSTKSLVIPVGRCLTVNNSITTGNDPNQIYIQSNSSGASGSLIFHNPQASPVQATVEMYSLATWNLINPVGSKYKWQFFGIPVRSLATASPTLDGAYVRELHEDDSPTHWVQLNNASGLTSFHGYEITQAAAKVYVFQGQLENNDYVATIPYTSGKSYPGQSLIGNPYTAAIDITKIVFGSQMLKTVYLYNTGTLNSWIASGQNPVDSTNTLTGQYTAVPLALAGTGTLPLQIPSMQAFLVRAKMSDSNATITIPYSAAGTVVKNTTMQRVSAMNKSSDSAKVWTQIDVKGSRFSDRMWIFTEPNCTHSFDNGWDGEKFIGSSLAPQLYAMEADGDYQVNSVDDINNSYLGFQAGEDNLYTLTFTHHNIGSDNMHLYLMDLVSLKTVDITSTGSTYVFEASTKDPTIKRFKIVKDMIVSSKPSATNTNNLHLKVFSSQRTVFIDNTSSSDGIIQIYNLSGQLIQQHPFTAHVITTLQTDLFPGTYVTKAITDKEKVSKQLILN